MEARRPVRTLEKSSSKDYGGSRDDRSELIPKVLWRKGWLTGSAHRLAVEVKEEGTQATLVFEQLGEQWHHIPSGYLNCSRHSKHFH